VEIQRPGLPPFGIEQGDTSGPLIDLTLIHTQRSDFADAQTCPVAQREDRRKTARRVLLHQLFEHKALFFGKFGWSQSYHGWTLHQARRIAAEVALIDRPPAESAQSRKRLAASTRRTAHALEGIHIPTNRRFRHEFQMERHPSWLRSQPGYKVAHGGQVCRDRFGVTRSQSISKLLEDRRVSAPRGHLSFLLTFATIDSPTRIGGQLWPFLCCIQRS